MKRQPTVACGLDRTNSFSKVGTSAFPHPMKLHTPHSQNRSEIQFQNHKLPLAEKFLDGGEFVFWISISNSTQIPPYRILLESQPFCITHLFSDSLSSTFCYVVSTHTSICIVLLGVVAFKIVQRLVCCNTQTDTFKRLKSILSHVIVQRPFTTIPCISLMLLESVEWM